MRALLFHLHMLHVSSLDLNPGHQSWQLGPAQPDSPRPGSGIHASPFRWLVCVNQSLILDSVTAIQNVISTRGVTSGVFVPLVCINSCSASSLLLLLLHFHLHFHLHSSLAKTPYLGLRYIGTSQALATCSRSRRKIHYDDPHTE